MGDVAGYGSLSAEATFESWGGTVLAEDLEGYGATELVIASLVDGGVAASA